MNEDMVRREHDRFAALAADIASPRVVSNIDRALEDNQRERTELVELRKMAVRRHGEPLRSTTAAQIEALIEERPAGLTLRALAHRYLHDQGSPFPKLRFKTREHYNLFIDRLADTHGDKILATLKKGDIEGFYQDWTKRGQGTAHAFLAMFRLLVNYGATTLDDRDCIRLAVILRAMRFKMATRGNAERLNADQVIAIRRMAHEMGFPSIALAQSFQFEITGLNQKDVIGEWVPLDEPGKSEVVTADNVGRKWKWLHGLRWSEINGDLILRHTTSARRREIEFDLKGGTMVMEELTMVGQPLPMGGPIIVSEYSKVPWMTPEFRRRWRIIARSGRYPR